jgi:hypothetical protein
VLPVSGPVNRRHLPNLSSITARACSDCSESHRCSPIIIVSYVRGNRLLLVNVTNKWNNASDGFRLSELTVVAALASQ